MGGDIPMKTARFLSIFHYLLVLFLLAPIILVIMVSFTPETFLTVPTTKFSLRWYRAIIDNPEFISGLIKSLYLAVTVSLICALIGTPAALAIARYRFWGRNFINNLFLLPLMVPTVVIGVGALQILSLIRLTGTFIGLVFAHVIICIPYMIRTMLVSFAGFDRNLELAAMNLGASWFHTFRLITLPIISPGLIAGSIFSFIISFDDLTVALFIAGSKMVTLPIRIYAHIQNYTDPLVAAVSTCIMLLTILIFSIVERLVGFSKVITSK
jgi:putative spermidine/putrescine transport system permease protein